MFRSLCSALALASLAAFADAPPEQVVEVTGEAPVMGKNVLGAKDKAIEVALRRAVEQVCGTLVESTTLVEKSQLVADRIFTQARGYVSKHEVLSESQDRGVYAVTVRATIGAGKLSDDLSAIGLTIARKGLPRIAVLVVEQRLVDPLPIAWWTDEGHKAGLTSLDQRIVENTLTGDWVKMGFTFVDPETVASGARTVGALDGNPSAAAIKTLGDKLQEADVVIVGSALVKKTAALKDLLADSHGGKNAVGQACSATVSLRILNADSGAEVLAAGEESKPANDLDDASCGRTALVAVTRALGARLKGDLIAKWNSQLQAGARVRIVVKNLDGIAAFNALKAAMGNEIRGATVTGTPRYAGGRADFDVLLKGPVDEAAEQLEAWRLKGRRLKVSSMSATAIEAEVAR